MSMHLEKPKAKEKEVEAKESSQVVKADGQVNKEAEEREEAPKEGAFMATRVAKVVPGVLIVESKATSPQIVHSPKCATTAAAHIIWDGRARTREKEKERPQ